MSQSKEYLTPREYADKFRLSRQRINQLLLAGLFPDAVRIGNNWAIPADARLPDVVKQR